MDKQARRVENIIYGPKKDMAIDKRGLGRMIFDKMQKFRHRILQIDASTEEQYTYEDINKKLIRMALEMRQRGIQSNDIVLTCSRNSMDTILPIYSTLYLNAVTVTLDPSISIRDAKHLIKTVAPKIIFVAEDGVDLIENACPIMETPTQIVVMGSHKTHATLSDFLKPHSDEDRFVPDDVKDLNNISNIFFSSGTTGLAKAILHSNYSMLKSCELTGDNIFSINTSLFYTSFYWISAFLFMTLTIMSGARRIYDKTFSPESFMKIIEKYKADFTFLSSTFVMQFTEENTSRNDKSSLKDFLWGGSVTSDTHVTNLRRCFPTAGLRFGYGLTEAGGIATIFTEHTDHLFRLKPNSCGVPFYNIQLKIIDPSTEKRLGPLQKGEVCVKTDTICKGYLSAAITTENPFDSDGFLKTGDIAYYDEDNCLFYCDRLKDMFKYQSWHVVPASIEIVIYEHPAVLETAVIGMPHEIDDNHPLALVVVRDGHNVTEEDLLAFIDHKLSDREKLRGGLRIVKRLPKTPTGKLARPQIRQIVVSGNLQQLLD